MKTILTSAVLVIVSILSAGAGIYLDRSWNQTSSLASPPYSPSSSHGRVVHALGSIQPSGGVIEVAVPAGLRALRFEEKTKVGNPVKAGEALAYLDGHDERLGEIQVIDEEIKAAEHNRQVENENERSALIDIERELEQNVRLGQMQLESAELKIKCLEQKHELARKQLEDVEGLQLNNTISRQQYQQLKVQAEISMDELRYAKAEKERQQKELDLATSAEAIERQKRKVRFAAERARALLPIETLRAKRALAEAGKKRCTVVAPVDGTILEITTREGESAVGKPLLKLGDTRALYVMAEVYTDDREGVQVNQKAEIAGRGLPLNSRATLSGIVERISPVVVGHKQSPLDPTYRENARVFEVWIKLELDQNTLEKLRRLILQPVDVTIGIGSENPAERVAEGRS
jgi:HlyD family secretion protein